MSTSQAEEPKRRRFGRRKDGKPGRLAQIKQVFQLTRQVDPSVTWWILGAVVGILAIGLAIGFATGHPIYFTFIALPVAALVAMIILSRKADRAMYKQLEGQPGAAGAALRMLRSGWTTQEEPVAVDPRTYDSVFRAVGRPGVVLVGDGPPHRIGKLLASEEKKHRRFISNAPITLVQVGDGEGQVPVSKLARHVMKLKPALTKDEVSQVLVRLRSMPDLRGGAPIPKGVDPARARPDRRAARGR
ncbi:MAG: DUF4191 domain-containing protein [Actinomycetales bacterium]